MHLTPRTFIVLGILFLLVPGYAIFEENESGVRPEGMAGAFIALADDISAIDFNPAGLMQVRSRQFQGFYKLLYGGVGVGLHTMQVSVGLPMGRLGTFGLRLQETGFQLHSERSLKLAHGFQLAEGLAFGYGLNGYNLMQRDFGQEFAFGLDIGMWTKIYRFWTAGFYVHNLNLPTIGQSDLPRFVALGLGFSPNPGIHSVLEFAKEPGMRTRVAFGQEFTIIPEHLILRAGVQTEPVRFAFGLGTGVERVRIDYALRSHSVLPWTHSVGITIKL